MPARIRSRHT